MQLLQASNLQRLLSFSNAHGADVNAVDSDGHKPLLTAAFEGNTEIAGLLIKSGANISARGGQGRALTIAKVKNHPAFIDLLNKN
ncbi:ankyrin repeat domain-containing protein [Metabacillus idriensis]|uniref:ankyrin repeat domain-containing protein n=1 Tax=Metabacillus idriensis TaxID=324768 RepID=UPI001CD2623F|nr:ankyrin repeat domain-containing protein [Metabacillus idriensis]